jgi:hypothetical protein
MHPKIKNRPAGDRLAIKTVKPLLLHDAKNPTAARRDPAAARPAPALANHARHHVPVKSQS